MRMRAKPVRALVRGCRICGALRPRMLTLQSGAMLCRPCGSDVSAFLRRAPPSFLDAIWVKAAIRPSPGSELLPSQVVENLVAEFRTGIAAVIRADDFKAHWDLASAYVEMDLRADAISELAISLDERAPDDMAQSAFDILFGPPRARPDALDRVVLALEREGRRV